MKKRFSLITLTFILFCFLFTTPCIARQMNILVYPFENTGDKEYFWISAGMTDTVIADLTHIKDISVVSNQDRKKALDEMKFNFSGLVEADKMMKLGRLTGANVIFSGSYLVSGSSIRVIARLVNTETGNVESSTKIDGTINGIFDLQDKVVFTLMGETGKITSADIKPVKITEQVKKQIEEKPRLNISAYEWYAKGSAIQDNNPKEALINFKKALDIDPDYTDALIRAGNTTGNIYNLFSEAFRYLEKAERIFKDRNNTKSSGYASLMMHIGEVYMRKGELDQALEYCINSLSIYEKLELQNTADYAKPIIIIGNIYQRKGQLDRALEYYLNSQSIYGRLGLQNAIVYTTPMSNIGSVYAMKGQLDRALEYYLDSQSIYDRLGLQNTESYAILKNNMGNVYQFKSQFDRSLECYLNSQSIYDRLGSQNTESYAMLMNNIGLVSSKKGPTSRALEYYLNSQSIYDRLGLQNGIFYSDLLYNMALLYEKQGQRDMAGRYFRMVYDTYVKYGYSGELRDKALNNARRLRY